MSDQFKERLLAAADNRFAEWFRSPDAVAAAKVRVAVSRMEPGCLYNVEWFRGIGEFRIGQAVTLWEDCKRRKASTRQGKRTWHLPVISRKPWARACRMIRPLRRPF